MNSNSFNEASEKFLQWFTALPGAQFSDAIKIVDLRDRNAGRGMIALKDIAPETILFTIPRKGIINIETSELPTKIPNVFDLTAVKDDENDDTPQMDSWSSLILVMIYEYLLGDKSTWKSYFDVLPSSFNTPMFWSEQELAELQTSHMRSKVGKASAEEMFRKGLLPIIRKNPSLFASSETRSDENLIEVAHRMGSTIMAYAFDLENDEQDEDEETEEWVEDRDGKSMLGMVPMADILNADAEFNAHVNHEEDNLTVTALRPIKAGEEILNYYGPHPNSELLRRYGYVSDKHSRYDVVEIPWEAVELVMAHEYDISRKLLDDVRNETDEEDFEDTFVLERETSEVNSDGTFAGPANFEGMPEDLQQQLKVVLKEVKKAQPQIIQDKRKRDEIHHAILVKTLERLISQYPTSAIEDQILLKKAELGSRTRMAIEVRLGEKKLLQEALRAITADEDTEMTMDGDDGPQKRTKFSS